MLFARISVFLYNFEGYKICWRILAINAVSTFPTNNNFDHVHNMKGYYIWNCTCCIEISIRKGQHTKNLRETFKKKLIILIILRLTILISETLPPFERTASVFSILSSFIIPNRLASFFPFSTMKTFFQMFFQIHNNNKQSPFRLLPYSNTQFP